MILVLAAVLKSVRDVARATLCDAETALDESDAIEFVDDTMEIVSVGSATATDNACHIQSTAADIVQAAADAGRAHHMAACTAGTNMLVRKEVKGQ